jgi:hypothetical protein
VAAVKALLRLFSLLFHALLALFLLAVCGLALGSGVQNVQLGMLPWTGPTLIYIVFFASLAGLATVALAFVGKWRVLFLVWSLAVALFLLKGYIFSGYRFAPGEAPKAFGLLVLSWLAVVGAWFQMWRSSGRNQRY